MILLFVSFIAGVLTVLAPCVLPLLPVIVGGSIGGGRSIKRVITVTASLAVSVIVFTLLIKASTLFIAIPQDFWKWFSGGIIIAFGLVTVFPDFWEKVPFLSRLSIGSNKLLSSGYQQQNFIGDVVVGAALGPVFSTCSPTYFLVLAAVLPENFGLGMLYLVAYSVGLSLSLFGVAFFGQKIVDSAGVAANPHGWFKKTLGALFIIVGIGIISGADKALQVKILDAGFFDVTKIEQKLLKLVPSENKSKEDALEKSEKMKKYVVAPEISSPDGFINTDGKPITLKELRGKVVLLDIWTYSCINCQRTLPYINAWYATYKDQGFEVVGLHTPEFAFEHVLKNVEEAVKKFGIKYPVVLDNDYSTWNDYGNRYWPRKYVIDVDGYIVYDHIGEGGYAETEKAIQAALVERNARMGSQDVVPTSLANPTDVMTVESYNVGSPEIYFGSSRRKQADGVYLGGSWSIASEYAENISEATIRYTYDAKNVYFVGGSKSGVDVEVYKDGVFIKTITIKNEQLYEIISGETYGKHVLEMKIKKPGLQAFTFTFG